MLLLIDNYDSFTYNLVHFLGELGAETVVRRNDALTPEEAVAMRPDGIVLSPGPCDPDKAGICLDLIGLAAGKLPILGVCLGHQAIGQAFGGAIVRAPEIMHGKLSDIRHDKTGVSLDGPDADSDASMYLPDTLNLAQEVIPEHAGGMSAQRRDLTEGTETKDGGNGVLGDDETSENLTVTWGEAAPNPNAATTLPPPDTGGEEPEPADHLLLTEFAKSPSAARNR